MWLKVPMPNTSPADVSRRLEIHWKKEIEAGDILGVIKHRVDFSGLFPLSSGATFPKSRKRACRGALIAVEVSFLGSIADVVGALPISPFHFQFREYTVNFQLPDLIALPVSFFCISPRPPSPELALPLVQKAEMPGN